MSPNSFDGIELVVSGDESPGKHEAVGVEGRTGDMQIFDLLIGRPLARIAG
jgi:hypothetical protein